MWTRKVAAPVVAVAAAALFAAGGSQVAASTPTVHASSATLSVSAAKSLAEKLRAEQKRKRSLLFTELSGPIRRSSSRIDFHYRDRSKSNVLCTARIVAVQTGSSRSAKFTNVSCHGIPGEVLAFESASRKLAGDVSAAGPGVRHSLHAYDNSLQECDKVVVPRNRRKDVDLLVDAGGVQAFFGPLRARLGDFARELHRIDAQDPVLVDGSRAWARTIVLLDQLPPAASDPCGAVREWSKNGFTQDTAPADFDVLAVVLRQMGEQNSMLHLVSRHLIDGGVVRGPAHAFTHDGLRAIVGH
jgi:hypothetical protein